MLDNISKQQKRILAIARNFGQISIKSFHEIYSKTESAQLFLKRLVSLEILIPGTKEGLYLYNEKNDFIVLQALDSNPQNQKLFKEVLPWVK